MKLKIIILLLFVLFFGSRALAMNDNQGTVLTMQDRTVYFDNNAKLKSYLKKQMKKLEKKWKKEAILNQNKYKLSYVRVMFFVDAAGKIQSYRVKSSCFPSDDTAFKMAVYNHIKTIKFDSLPKDYKNKVIVLTVKFNSFLSPDYLPQRVNSDLYGVADLEIAKNKSCLVMSSKKSFCRDK